MHNFFVESIASAGELQNLPSGEAEHLFRTLRAIPGDEVGVLDGKGGKGRCKVESGRRLRVMFSEHLPEPDCKLHLFVAAPRKLKLDTLLKQCAELGVTTVTLVSFERSVAQPLPGERQAALLREGCKQSGNPFLPMVRPPVSFEKMLEMIADSGIKCFFGAIRSGSGAEVPPESGGAGWIVGPEGGFTAGEEARMREVGAIPLNLGPWVLRLETAAVAGLAVIRRMMVKTGIFLLMGVLLLLFAPGCGRDSGHGGTNHPMKLQGDKFRNEGNYESAELCYRKWAAMKPGAAEPMLALGTLYDEALSNPAAALYCYNEFLRLAPAEYPDRKMAESYRELIKAKLLKELAGERLPTLADVERIKTLEKENAALKAKLRFLLRQQKR